MRFPLKDYQQQSLDLLASYAKKVRAHVAKGTRRPERAAFEQVTGREYWSTPGFENTPYICLRLPTGAGKTLLAAHAIGTIGRHLLETDRSACLWITPSTTIRDQTLRALKQPHHPYRLALEEAVGTDVEIATLQEAIMMPRLVRGATPLVLVTTIQAYRIEDSKGRELADTRRIYRDNGGMQEALSNLPRSVEDELSTDSQGLVDLSLANALKLRRPIVVMDEAHNARTPISFDSLARFGPSFVLELTATPEQRHDPQHATKPTFASNVLHAVSALEVKNEGMIKLPVDLESRSDWLEVLAATKNRREELELIADRAHEDHGLPFLRPIALVQAQPHSKTKETHTVEKVKEALIDRLGIPAEEVVICTGSIDELGDTDLMADGCPVRYVVTVDKLREGWDCPLAYVLGSIGNTATATAVEQLIGRILRMPNGTPTRIPALDRCYAFVLSDNIIRTAGQLRDQMVKTCGFDERSVSEALRISGQSGQMRAGFGRIPLEKMPEPSAIPTSLAARMEYDDKKKELVLTDLPTAGELRCLVDAVQSESDKQAVNAYWESERPAGVTTKPLTEMALPMRVPRLTVIQDGKRRLLEPVELDEFAWALDQCKPMLTEQEFASDFAAGTAAEIDIESTSSADDGGLTVTPQGDVRLRQLELLGEGEDWTDVELVRWLDRELHRGDSLLGLPQSESQPWLGRVIAGLLDNRQLDRGMVVRRRHALAELLRTKVTDHGRKQTRRAADELFQKNPEAIVTSNEHSSLIEEREYKPVSLYEGGIRFRHHAFDLIAHMNKSELECAEKIDLHANVKRWLRNTDRLHEGGFWLPLSPGRFFPDFIVELQDGTLLLVEYKMEKMSHDPAEQHKKKVGQMWADRSDGRCQFGWVVGDDWAALDRALKGSELDT